MPKEVVLTVPGRSVISRGPSDESSFLEVALTVAVAPVNNMLDSAIDAYIDGMLEMFRVMGNVPDCIMNYNNKEVIIAFFQGLMSQGHSGGGPRGSPGS